MTAAPRPYRDLSAHGGAVHVVLVLTVALAAASLIVMWWQLELLHAAETGIGVSPEAFVAQADASDRRVSLVGYGQLAVTVVSAIVILSWIFRANANARALGARDMTFSPGWSVGWYFIPFANLVLPVQAMAEIWRASLRPADPDAERAPGLLLGLWWTFWLTGNLTGAFAARMGWEAETLDELEIVTVGMMASDALSIACCAVFAIMVAQLGAIQNRTAAAQL